MSGTNVMPGMRIFSDDEVEIGTVKEVWATTAAHGCLPVSRYLLEDYGPIKGTRQILNMEEGYLQVRRRNSVGSDSRDLWVPLDAVGAVNSHDSVTLRAAAEMCESDFVQRPHRLAPAA